jgi:hypothetical protein
MAKYDVKFSCGHTETVYLYGPLKDRYRKIEWMESTKVCSACYQAEKEEAKKAEVEAVAARADEYGLPELTGSEKQVAWALAIRDAFFETAQKELEAQGNEFGKHVYSSVINGYLENTDAKWWIDHRNSAYMTGRIRLGSYVEKLLKYFEIERTSPDVNERLGDAMLKLSESEVYNLLMAAERGEDLRRGVTPVTAEQIEAEAETAAARIIRPEDPQTETVAVIEKSKSMVYVKTPVFSKRAVGLLKKMGFTWEKYEHRWAWKYNEAVNDRVIEIAVHLLSWGYVVSVPELWMVEKIQNADYQPLNTRKVYVRPDGEKFGITWHRDDGDFYDAAKRIDGARWDRDAGVMSVPSTSFDEVLDFAEMYGFAVSDKVKALTEKAKIMRDKALVADVKPIVKEMPEPTGGKPKKLNPVKAEIDASLRDEYYEEIQDEN